ncbi:uncharacterized protein JCM10292_000208 [Rhodotorula paludigena]|uniref:uncharacterized protein n=1 Tax=Rhodotorula paludigena TaxID=86838 RepID=UPI00317B5704
MLEPAHARSLYRSFWRGIARLPRLHRSKLANLRRLLRQQARDACTAAEGEEKTVKDTFDRTLSMLAASPRLVKNLASLHYHHAPTHIRGTPNTTRLAHLPRPIVWDPKDPGAAQRAWDKRAKDRERDPAWHIAESVDEGLRRLVRDAEGAAGGVLFGRNPQVGGGRAA